MRRGKHGAAINRLRTYKALISSHKIPEAARLLLDEQIANLEARYGEKDNDG